MSNYRLLFLVSACLFGGCAGKMPPPSLVPPGANRPLFETIYTYAYTLTEPMNQNRLEYQDAIALCRLIPKEKEIGVEIYNLSDKPIMVDWDKVQFVDPEGLLHTVVHELVPLADISRRQTPSLIMPQGMLSDSVAPKDYVFTTITGWEQRSIFPRSAAASGLKGQSFGVTIPIKIENEVKLYALKFAIADVSSYTIKRN